MNSPHDYTGILIGAAATLCGGILAATTAFLTNFFEHRWQAKQDRIKEKKQQIERLLNVAQLCFQHCVIYRSDLTSNIARGDPIRGPDTLSTLADDAERIAMLYVRECLTEVKALSDNVHALCTCAVPSRT